MTHDQKKKSSFSPFALSISGILTLFVVGILLMASSQKTPPPSKASSNAVIDATAIITIVGRSKMCDSTTTGYTTVFTWNDGAHKYAKVATFTYDPKRQKTGIPTSAQFKGAIASYRVKYEVYQEFRNKSHQKLKETDYLGPIKLNQSNHGTAQITLSAQCK